ncbi:hypothetical protein BDQ12DRAFT_674135 [Crucibulum laeve]|uniref:Uncharacterized protein n=1 Tax=Crucibulum laeve TaxID=68775 RepID=A0A5C3MUP6_9AGAR|nr:hypothetical protein BDQ12DRAFT_674135 [Crucibulum laeve]
MAIRFQALYCCLRTIVVIHVSYSFHVFLLHSVKSMYIFNFRSCKDYKFSCHSVVPSLCFAMLL